MQEAVLQLSQQIAERRYGKFRGFVEDNEPWMPQTLSGA